MNQPIARQQVRSSPEAFILFADFFLIILSYYQIKPFSRSIFLESVGSDRLPYIWIASAITLGLLMPFYNKLVRSLKRYHLVFGSLAITALALLLFRFLFEFPSAPLVVIFYVFVDIVSVILVEQFWSLANSVFRTSEGKRWYGLVGSGGLFGGIAGGVLAGSLLKHQVLSSIDLVLVSAAILILVLILNILMHSKGFFSEVITDQREQAASIQRDWQTLKKSRYLMLIIGMILIAQIVEPIVEYQFLRTMQSVYSNLEARTEYLSWFLSLLGAVALGINLIITPLVHRFFGAVAGLFAQPLMLLAFALSFSFKATLPMAAVLKIADRGLSYSINRASKELLYIPLNPALIYQAKAWVDMFGYRLFKVFGSVMILVLTQWFPWKIEPNRLSWFVVTVSLVWLFLVHLLSHDYKRLAKE